MEFLTSHLAHIERKHPSLFPLQNFGYVRKTNRQFIKNNTFSTINFSFILEGSGIYNYGEGNIEIKAPYLITQCNKRTYNYGPRENESWIEAYFMFPTSSIAHFTQANLYSLNKLHWPILNSVPIEKHLEELFTYLKQRESLGVIDLIDRISERIILESIRIPQKESNQPYHQEMKRVNESIIQNIHQPIDFFELSESIGLSYSAFRKYWKTYFKKSPQLYLNEKRMQEAKRLLVETNMSISDIAYHLQYEDRLYFSKKFKQFTQVTASQYRKIHEHQRHMLSSS